MSKNNKSDVKDNEEIIETDQETEELIKNAPPISLDELDNFFPFPKLTLSQSLKVIYQDVPENEQEARYRRLVHLLYGQRDKTIEALSMLSLSVDAQEEINILSLKLRIIIQQLKELHNEAKALGFEQENK